MANRQSTTFFLLVVFILYDLLEIEGSLTRILALLELEGVCVCVQINQGTERWNWSKAGESKN